MYLHSMKSNIGCRYAMQSLFVFLNSFNSLQHVCAAVDQGAHTKAQIQLEAKWVADFSVINYIGISV